MNCYLCGSKKYIKILNKQKIPVWTNAADGAVNRKRMYKCIINQCTDCGHIYQPMGKGLRRIINDIYMSDNAQASTPMGKGNWGMERARDFLEKLDLKGCKSAIEIGCADGHILRRLETMGFKKLVGIDPSVDKTEGFNGILFLKDFADGKLKLSQKYDLIFSNGVFEHVEKITGLLDFCKNNLSENGKMFFSVPNAQRQLEEGDPGLFLHQHAHYYTQALLKSLLQKSGFKVKSLKATKDSINVSALFKGNCAGISKEISFYSDYSEKLDRVLERIQAILEDGRVIVHGANNALNNILGWFNKDFNFTLVDNDSAKEGRRYFNRTVRSIDEVRLSDYDTVLIIPSSFYEVISSQYRHKGFRGRFENIEKAHHIVKRALSDG